MSGIDSTVKKFLVSNSISSCLFYRKFHLDNFTFSSSSFHCHSILHPLCACVCKCLALSFGETAEILLIAQADQKICLNVQNTEEGAKKILSDDCVCTCDSVKKQINCCILHDEPAREMLCCTHLRVRWLLSQERSFLSASKLSTRIIHRGCSREE